MAQTLTHWKKLTNPDYLGAYALNPGEDMIVTIKHVAQADVVGNGGKKERKTVVFFLENVKPMVLNRTNSKTITKLFGTPYIEQWGGKKIQVYIEHDIQAFGEIVDGLRVRPFLPKEDKPICEECGEEIGEFDKYSANALASYTRQKYGKQLCEVCAAGAKAAQEAKDGGQ